MDRSGAFPLADVWHLAWGGKRTPVRPAASDQPREPGEFRLGQVDLERYTASGPDALADGQRRNGSKPRLLEARLLTAEVLEVVRLRLAEPPPDGGLWSSREVADVIAAHLGLERVLSQRGWDALKALG